MAILNYSKTLSEKILGILEAPSTSSDYLKLIFTGDGHIITHGYDYTALATSDRSGLLLKYSGITTNVLKGSGKWENLTISDLPIANNLTPSNNKLFTSLQVSDYVGESFKANDAMRFKGTITILENGSFQTTLVDSTVPLNSFPTLCLVGDTYRIGSSGKYLGSSYIRNCSSGDLLICIKDGEGSGLNTLEYWTPIEANINGYVTSHINNSAFTIYSNNTEGFDIYAPTTGGATGSVLVGNGTKSTPKWQLLEEITVNDISETAKKELIKNITVSLGDNGSIILSYKKNEAIADTTIPKGTIDIIVSGVAHSLKVGTGLSMGITSNIPNTFNGSSDRTINLVAATTSQLGGVIIDDGTKLDLEIKKPTISISDGKIYLTLQNIINALGFTPGDSDKTATFTTVLTNSATETTSGSTDNPFLNLVQTINTTKTVVGSTLFYGGNGISIVNVDNKLTVSIKLATNDELGGIKTALVKDNVVTTIETSIADRNYGLQVDKNGKAFVNVPHSWRPITIGGNSIDNDTLNFVPSGDIYLKADTKEDTITDISFGLNWFNIDDNNYEIKN